MVKNKNQNCIWIWQIALLIIFAAGCTDHFDALNTPDDRLSTENLDATNLGQAFARAQFASAGGSGFQTSQSLFADLYAQYFATSAQNFNSDQYVQVGGWSNATWNRQYVTVMPPLHFVEQFTENEGMEIQNAMAKIWKVYHHHRTTDYWGPIIYSEFGNGETTVQYDSQEDVYMEFFRELDNAIEILKENLGGNAFGSNDLVYSGDVNKWLVFANSLRLRLAMRIVYVEPGKAQLEAEKAVSEEGGVMMDNSDNANVRTYEENSFSEYTRVTAWGEFRMSASMQSVLEGFEDPRIESYFEEAQDGGYKGFRNGLPDSERNPGQLNPAHSNMHEYWQNTRTAPYPVMRAAEVYFLRAEGALRGWDMGGTAENLYNEGVRQSMQEYTHHPITDSEIDDYITRLHTPVALGDNYNTPPLSDIPVRFDETGSFERKLEQIITQKWIGLYPDGWEAWAEYRRTQYPRLYPRIVSANPDVGPDEIFRRMVFVTGEYSNNNSAVQNAIQLLGGEDRNSTRLWWDARDDRPENP